MIDNIYHDDSNDEEYVWSGSEIEEDEEDANNSDNEALGFDTAFSDDDDTNDGADGDQSAAYNSDSVRRHDEGNPPPVGRVGSG